MAKENWVCGTCGGDDVQVMLTFAVWAFHNQQWVLNENEYPAYCPHCGGESKAIRKVVK